MDTLIIHDTFEPYYAGKKRFTAPASDAAAELQRRDGERANRLTAEQRDRLLKGRAAKPETTGR